MSTKGWPTDAAGLSVELPPVPYPGLRPFDKKEWPIFFGRERMADEIVDRLIRQQLAVVHGDSGCGKSSLLRAGVLARLDQGNGLGTGTWRTCATQPRDAPMNNLAAALAGLIETTPYPNRILDFRRVLNFGADAPPALAKLLGSTETNNFCILIDQFEELFAFARRHGPEEAKLLVQMLVALLKRPPAGLYVALTMRSEFLGVCAQFAGLAEAVNDAQYLLPRMTQLDLMRAIREPATLYGGGVSVELAERLIVDAGGGQDELPLIQHGLMTLHRRKVLASTALLKVWRLDVADYTHVGGLGVALSHHADQVCSRIGMPPERTTETLFRALTDINAEGQAIRRPQTFQSLLSVTDTDERTLMSALNAFRAEGTSFLSPYGSEPIGPTTLVDISHEALIRCWGKIAEPKDGWLAREFRDGLVWRSLLVQADSFDANASNLLSAATAEERETWLTQHIPAWAERYGGGWIRVSQLVQASVDAGRRAVETERKNARVRLRWIRSTVVILLLSSVTAGWLYARTQSTLDRLNRVTASSLWSRLIFNSAQSTDNDELNALWELTLSNQEVRREFLGELVADHGRIEKFARRPVPVARALFFQWPQASSKAVGDSLLNALSKTPDGAQLGALSTAIHEFGITLTASQAKPAVVSVLRTFDAASNPAAVRNLGSVMPALAAIMTPASASEALASVLSAIPSSRSIPLQLLGPAAKELAARLGPNEAHEILEPLSKAMATAVPVSAASGAPLATSRVRALSGIVPTLASRLSEGEVQQVVAPLIERLMGAGDVVPLASVVTVIGVDNLTPLQADAALTKLLSAIPTASSRSFFDTIPRTIGLAVQALAKRLPADQLPSRAKPLGLLLEHAKPLQMTALAPSILALSGGALTSAQASVLTKQSLDAITILSVRQDLDLLGASIKDASTGLSASQIAALVSRINGEIGRTDDPDQADILRSVNHALAPRLSANQAESVLVSALRLIGRTSDSDQLNALSSSAKDLAQLLTLRQAQGLFGLVLAIVPPQDKSSAAQTRAEALAPVLQTIARKITPEQAKATLAAILKALPQKPSPADLHTWALLASAVGHDIISTDDARRLLEPARDQLLLTSDPAELRRLALTVAALGDRLPAPERVSMLDVILKARALSSSTTTSAQSPISPIGAIQAMGEAIHSLVLNLPAEQASNALTRLVNAIGAATDPVRLQTLESALPPLLEKQPRDRQEAVTYSLLGWCRTPDQCADRATRVVAVLPHDSRDAAVSGIVRALRYPSASRSSTDVLLDALQSIVPAAPGKTAGLQANVDWIAQTYPAALRSQAACPPPLNGANFSCPASSQ